MPMYLSPGLRSYGGKIRSTQGIKTQNFLDMMHKQVRARRQNNKNQGVQKQSAI